jgi:hypothetical protein
LLQTARMPWRRLLGFGALALVLIECAFWIARADRPALPPTCAAWDETARHTLAPMQANTVLASRPLNEALAQLRRARQSCQSGRLEQARKDYEALAALSGPASPQ